MYIEFSLRRGDGGFVSNQTITDIVQALESWASQYNVTYNKKIIKYNLRVTFDDEQLYSHFALTWNLTQIYQLKYRLIEPMQTRQP
jgi:hypothetical protein